MGNRRSREHATARVRARHTPAVVLEMLANLRKKSAELWETPHSRKVRRISYHVMRGAKKFILGTGNAAWVVGTTMLVMVMPLVFEIDREQALLDYDSMGSAASPAIPK